MYSTVSGWVNCQALVNVVKDFWVPQKAVNFLLS